MLEKSVVYESSLDHDFLDEIYTLPGGHEIKHCIQCGTCSGSCPQGAVMDHARRKIFSLIRAGTGTGVSARAAIHRARGELGVGEKMVIESLIGSRFTVRVLEETEFGPFQAVIPEVEGSASITGRNEFVIHPDDPLRDGFILR